MLEQAERQYGVRDDMMLDTADRFHLQYGTDKADFEGYNLVMFPLTYAAGLLAKIDAARAYDRDELVIDEQVEETVTVESKLKDCGVFFRNMKPIVKSTFPDNNAVWNQFGFNDFAACRNSQGKMIIFMDTLYKAATNHSAALIAGGFAAPQIAMIKTLADALREDEAEQEAAKKERPLKTQTRINLYNEVWAEMQNINRASKAIYMGNYAKLNQYELPAGSNAGNVPVTGEVPPGVTVKVLEMEFTSETKLKIKNTGTIKLSFGLAADAVTPVANLSVAAMSEITVTADNLGDVSLHFLNATNNIVTGTGSYEVSLVL